MLQPINITVNDNFKYNYLIKSIELDDILQYDKEKYNSSNHWKDNIKPDNYDFIISQTHTSKWIDLFKNYKKIIIDNSIYIKWIKQANIICSQTGKFSNLFLDEFESMTQQLNEQYKELFNGDKYFVRVNDVSLKSGQHKTGPYYEMKTILESIVSCTD